MLLESSSMRLDITFMYNEASLYIGGIENKRLGRQLLMNEKIAYGNDVISTTENSRDQVRNRPQIYFGTNDLKGCLNGLFELVTNI